MSNEQKFKKNIKNFESLDKFCKEIEIIFIIEKNQ